MLGKITVYDRLAQIQQDLHVNKSNFNAFGKYRYRSCEDIIEAVKPLLDGAVLTISDDIQEVGDRVYVRATATFYYNESEVEVSAFAREESNKKGMDACQITGSASSYARKYALNGLFCIDDTKDPDCTNVSNDNNVVSQNKILSKKIMAMCSSKGIKDVNNFARFAKFSANNIDSMHKVIDNFASVSDEYLKIDTDYQQL